jgi:hypothetical protein
MWWKIHDNSLPYEFTRSSSSSKIFNREQLGLPSSCIIAKIELPKPSRGKTHTGIHERYVACERRKAKESAQKGTHKSAVCMRIVICHVDPGYPQCADEAV